MNSETYKFTVLSVNSLVTH